MALVYSRAVLKQLSSSSSAFLSPNLWCRLTEHGITRIKPTRRGCRGGRKKHGNSLSCPGSVPQLCADVTPTLNEDVSMVSVENATQDQELINLHNRSASSLNFQGNTFQAGKTNNLAIPSVPPENGTSALRSSLGNSRTDNNPVITDYPTKSRSVFGLSLMLANTMSLAPKIDEVRSTILDLKPNLGFFTETWLRDTVSGNQLHVPGYSFIFRNRTTDFHGGIGLYIENSIKYRSLDHLQDPEFEALWAWLRPKRLPRGIPCVVAATLYHPFFNDSGRDTALLDYLSATLTTVEGEFPGCGILLCGDFNRLKVNRLAAQFRLRQLVDKPTRGDQILDLVLTNQPDLYDKNSVQTLPPFGLSDHNVVFVRPTIRAPRDGPSRRTVSKRDTRASRKSELGRFLVSIDWSVVSEAPNCETKLALFTDFIKIGLDHIMPVKNVRLHLNDPPWVTEQFKNLIKLRQHAFHHGDMEQYRRYRNEVNRARKSLRSNYFANKVNHLKNTKPSQWWSAVKRIAGMNTASSSDGLLSNLQLGDDFDQLSDADLANAINAVFLEPTKHYQPLNAVPTVEVDSDVPFITESAVLSVLNKLNPRKAVGPDGIGNWLLREYAEILVLPITSILNASFREQRLPASWKLADVVPLPKQKPVEVASKHLRPISLTPAISKVAEDFVVSKYVGPAVLKIIDPNQYGGIPRSSTLFALISMVHNWSQATDATGAAVRVVLFDYCKAFDLIDHNLLARKTEVLDMPRWVRGWVLDFLSDRKQRVKLSSDCRSEWGPVPAGVPQGTKLGPWLFLLMINDLKVDAFTWKYVDDTTIAQTIPRGSSGDVQSSVSAVEVWSNENRMELNADKCKEMRIDFKRNTHNFPPIVVNEKELTVSNSVKILGVTISSDLKWNEHISECIKKANKRLYFIVLLKRAKVPLSDIVNFYCTAIRPVLEYCAPVFHHALPQYLSDDIERVQKRVLSIISPYSSYSECLTRFDLLTLHARRVALCNKLFESLTSCPDHKLSSVLPPKREHRYNLRQSRAYTMPRIYTNRFKNTFIPSMCSQ